MYYCEFASTKYARHGTMLPAIQSLQSGIGYSSIFQFSKEDALEIRNVGSSKGLKRFAVYAEWIWFDIDDENIAEAAYRYRELVERFSEYEKVGYFSGKKGYHLGVKIDPMYGRNVPYSHRRWVRENNLVVDESLYQHGRLFRNVGAIHESSGLKKRMLLKTEGKTLHIPTVIEPVRSTPEYTESYSNEDIFRANLYRAILMIENPPDQDIRHTRLWGWAQDMCDNGVPYELTLALAKHVNGMFPTPKTDEEVEVAVDQGYGNSIAL